MEFEFWQLTLRNQTEILQHTVFQRAKFQRTVHSEKDKCLDAGSQDESFSIMYSVQLTALTILF